MLKVHPMGVISVSNIADTLAVVVVNGARGKEREKPRANTLDKQCYISQRSMRTRIIVETNIHIPTTANPLKIRLIMKKTADTRTQARRPRQCSPIVMTGTHRKQVPFKLQQDGFLSKCICAPICTSKH